MLYRGTSDIALFATFGGSEHCEAAAVPAHEQAPSPEAIELEKLRSENFELMRDLRELRDQGNKAVAQARKIAHEEAAQAHRDDDEARIQSLAATLDRTIKALEQFLGQNTEKAAVAIASKAIKIFVASHENDEDWLERVIAARLMRLRTLAGAAVHVAPADYPRLCESQLMSQGTVVADPSVAAGKAVIRLSLGEILVDPQEGISRVLEALDKAELGE